LIISKQAQACMKKQILYSVSHSALPQMSLSVIYKPSSRKEHKEQEQLAILHAVSFFVLGSLDSTC